MLNQETFSKAMIIYNQNEILILKKCYPNNNSVKIVYEIKQY